MAVDPTIQQKADDIRMKIYGEQVRESLASGLEAMSSDVVEVEGRQDEVEGRQDEVEEQFQNVIENTTDKDVISAPELIAARNGEDNLKARLDKENQEVTAQLAQIALQTQRSNGSDDTNTIKSTIESADGGGTVLFPKGNYYANAITLSGLKNITIIGDLSNIIYNGSSDVAIQGSNNSHIFKFENCENITIKDLTLTGKMFSGMNKNNLPVKQPITDNEYVQPTHEALNFTKTNDITIENVNVNEIPYGIKVLNSNKISVNKVTIKEVLTGIRFLNVRQLHVKDTVVEDARFNFYRIESGTSEPLVETVGSGGSGFLIENSNGFIENCVARRSGTNSFRIEGGSVVVFSKCKVYQARRHGFSIYGNDSIINYDNCYVFETADPSFWNGKDNEETFRRPHTVGEPISFVLGGNNNRFGVLNCYVLNNLYEDGNLPATSNINGEFQAVVQGRLLTVSSGNTGYIKNSTLEGFTTNDSINIEGSGTILSNNTIKGSKLTSEDYICYCVRINTDNVVFKDNYVFYGRDGITGEGKGHVMTGNNVYKSYRNGFYLLSFDTFLDGNLVVDASYNLSVNGKAYHINRTNTTMGTNVAMDTRDVVASNYALSIGSSADGFFPGHLIVKGNIPDKVDRSLDLSKFATPAYGKAINHGNSSASDLEGLKEEVNSLATKLRISGLMETPSS